MSIKRLLDGYVPSPLAVTLSGFVENGVTYESHTFFVRIRDDGRLACGPAVNVSVRHGGGWETLDADPKIAVPLLALIANGLDREAFFLCWGLFDRIRKERLDAVETTATEYRQAFCEGRLRKRKLRGQNRAKVWIEPRSVPCSEAA